MKGAQVPDNQVECSPTKNDATGLCYKQKLNFLLCLVSETWGFIC